MLAIPMACVVLVAARIMGANITWGEALAPAIIVPACILLAIIINKL